MSEPWNGTPAIVRRPKAGRSSPCRRGAKLGDLLAANLAWRQRARVRRCWAGRSRSSPPQARREICRARRRVRRRVSAGRDALFGATRPTRSAPLIVTGHQPGLVHPGVWVKNFAAAELAAAHGGVGLHVVIDADVCRSPAILVPGGTVDAPRLASVEFDAPAPAHAVGRAPHRRRATVAVVSRARARSGGAVARRAVSRRSGGRRPSSAAPRRAWSAPRSPRRGIAPRSTGAAATSSCRKASCARPARSAGSRARCWPNCRGSSPRTTARWPTTAATTACATTPIPCPISPPTARGSKRRSGSGRRPTRGAGRCSCAPTAGGLLRLRSSRLGTAPAAHRRRRRRDGASPSSATWEAAGVKLRSRALITTMFTRLAVADLFIHGIGGAKYDEATDAICERFFGAAPPAFATLSGTLRLPIDHPPRRRRRRSAAAAPAARADVSSGAHARICTTGRRRAAPRPQPLAAEKARWVRTPKIAGQRRRAASGHRRGQRGLAAVRRRRSGTAWSGNWPTRRPAARANRVLDSREFAFCLFPRKLLEQFLLDFAAEAL